MENVGAPTFKVLLEGCSNVGYPFWNFMDHARFRD
jgi:hypothetical protein